MCSEKHMVSHLKSMLEIAFEFVNFDTSQVEMIYVFCSTEEGYMFDFFYSIDGKIMQRHQVNNVLKQSIDSSDEKQFFCLETGNKDLLSCVDKFEKKGEEVPTRIMVSYAVKNEKINIDFSYEKRLIGTDLMADDLLTEWITELSKK